MSLEDELRSAGRSVVVPPVDDGLTAAVLTRVADVPVRKRLRDRWRAFLAGFLVLLAGAALTPPVRATVAEWLRIGGVQAQPVGSGPTTAPPPPTATGHLSLEAAARVAGFTPKLPQALGAPSGVEASAGFLAASWGSVRLEQFQSGLELRYIKQYWEELEFMPELDGFWFSTPHELVLVDSRVIRVAGPTLVWVRDGITYRLEGVGKARAIELATGTS
ncbi:hypothetical protein [Kribbella sp. NPDC048915]|uniref:hypothetical protein n=1 Tax=Kribbella sp. NPDC048915 TaxID=3155148 RepID=UPI0033C7427C